PPHQPPAPSSSRSPTPSPQLDRDRDSEHDSGKHASGKSLPVHCVVEAVSAVGFRRRPVVETDSYVIIPVATAFADLVGAALVRLGYPSDMVAAARGSVVIKNWKPLSLEKIAEGPLATVGDILGELSTVATLRIEVYRARPTVMSEIKDKLLRLLLLHSHTMLASSGCPLDEMVLSYMCRGSSPTGAPHPDLNEDCRRKFEQWWNAQVSGYHRHPPPQPPPPQPKPSAATAAAAAAAAAGVSAPDRTPEGLHPALQTVQSQYPTQKTRMRTSFDPELELPRLQRWFAENQHPSRQQIQQYVKELNTLESRRGRKQLDVNNVVYWFKNARAAQKRAELRSIGPGILSLNGYNSSSHSPPGPMMSGGGSTMGSTNKSESPPLHSPGARGLPPNAYLSDNSAGGSDDEEAGPPASPVGPLSLTTNDRASRPSSPKGHTASPVQMDNIKQEPPDEVPSPPSGNNNNCSNDNTHNNNNNLKECDDMTEGDEEDEDEEMDELEERRKDELCPPEHDLRRIQQFHSPSPTEQMGPRIHGHGNPPHSLGFPLVSNSMFSHSIMYMSHYLPGLSQPHHGLGPPGTPPTSQVSAPPASSSSGLNLSALSASADERRKRNRTFIDPVTEVPRLEQWFALNTHPSHNLILKYTEELNRMPYRQKFPKLEPKNVQFWFKNRRAKNKRLKMSLFDTPPPGSHQYRHQSPPGHE
ncbi:zinc finger homeobox protein 4, partial [Schistocerca cancellata]|uniref:zinc finger homeobox protein 4 n=1 Tax=Schistocerca cancellata TaxID=274614 RepID=UPI002119401D